MSSSHLAFVQQSPEGCMVPEETMSLESSHKRCIASRSHSPDEKVRCKSQKRRKSARAKGRPENSGLSFACLFYKRDPITYGGENGCSAWCNESIETVVRHHILDKHRKANTQRITNNEDHCLDDKRFEEVAKFKRQRISGKSKEKYAEETWKAVYALLFGIDEEAKDEIPDPYFVSTTRPNNSGLNINDIEKIIQRRVSEEPSLGLRFEYYYRQKEKCERDRQREKENLRLAADQRKGELKIKISQLEIQIREIDERQAKEAQNIDDRYEERISSNHSQLMAIVMGEQDAQTKFPPDLLARPVPSVGTSFGFEPPVPTHASRSQISGFVQGYADTQFGFAERDAEDVLLWNYAATSPTATSAQLGSSNPSFPANKCAICSTANSSESLWCEDCRPIAGFDEI